MKKNFLLIALGFSLSSLIASEMPPMPPGFFDSVDTKVGNTKKAEEEVVKKVKRRIFPKECDALPPMLYNFPPPMQVDMDKCTAKLFEPKSETLLKQLSKLEGASVEIISVKESDNFKRVYEVKYKIIDNKEKKFKVLNDKKLDEKTVYSNSDATKFFTNKPIEVK